MKIVKKTRGIAKYLNHVKDGQVFYLGIVVQDKHLAPLEKLGFSNPPKPGEQLLPDATWGTASDKNANGYIVKHTDLPKETAYRQGEWRWKQFKGRYECEEKSKIVDIPYQRYPRTIVPAYAINLEVLQNGLGEIIVVAGPFTKESNPMEVATNTSNMLVDIFKECLIFNKDLFSWKKSPLRQLNWELLPPGKNPWQSGKSALQGIVSRSPTGNQPVIQARFDAVGNYEPEFIAVGKAGFDGYVIFGFPTLGFCILESRAINNATYVLNDDSWENISALSKAEILQNNAHKARFVHRETWFSALHNLFRKKAA